MADFRGGQTSEVGLNSEGREKSEVGLLFLVFFFCFELISTKGRHGVICMFKGDVVSVVKSDLG